MFEINEIINGIYSCDCVVHVFHIVYKPKRANMTMLRASLVLLMGWMIVSAMMNRTVAQVLTKLSLAYNLKFHVLYKDQGASFQKRRVQAFVLFNDAWSQ